MEESILKINKQFNFRPEIIGGFSVEQFSKYVIGGMGGSHLAGGILKMLLPEKDISIHRDYGLPVISSDSEKDKILFIASSYSGNTEEALDFADEAYSRGLNLLIVTKGGKLLDFAKENNVPFIQMPQENIQPRVALGYSLISLTKVISPDLLEQIFSLGQIIDEKYLKEIKDRSTELLPDLFNKIPVIYSSGFNRPIAYNWKIKFNETAKIPAFYNSFPELNHNEMQGYDFNQSNQELSKNFCFIFLKSGLDDLRIEKRMYTLAEIYQAKGLPVLVLDMSGQNLLEMVFNTLLLADFLSLGLATQYKTEPEKVPLIEEFKNKLKRE